MICSAAGGSLPPRQSSRNHAFETFLGQAYTPPHDESRSRGPFLGCGPLQGIPVQTPCFRDAFEPNVLPPPLDTPTLGVNRRLSRSNASRSWDTGYSRDKTGSCRVPELGPKTRPPQGDGLMALRSCWAAGQIPLPLSFLSPYISRMGGATTQPPHLLC